MALAAVPHARPTCVVLVTCEIETKDSPLHFDPNPFKKLDEKVSQKGSGQGARQRGLLESTMRDSVSHGLGHVTAEAL